MSDENPIDRATVRDENGDVVFEQDAIPSNETSTIIDTYSPNAIASVIDADVRVNWWRHRIRFGFDGTVAWGFYLEVVCPYKPEIETKPCAAFEKPETREGFIAGCGLAQWLDDAGVDEFVESHNRDDRTVYGETDIDFRWTPDGPEWWKAADVPRETTTPVAISGNYGAAFEIRGLRAHGAAYDILGSGYLPKTGVETVDVENGQEIEVVVYNDVRLPPFVSRYFANGMPLPVNSRPSPLDPEPLRYGDADPERRPLALIFLPIDASTAATIAQSFDTGATIRSFAADFPLDADPYGYKIRSDVWLVEAPPETP